MLDLFLVALVQGITEFLPISSAGHLIILREVFGIAKHALIIDVAAHLGTLCAAIVYFRKTLASFFAGLAAPVAPQWATAADRRLVLLVVVASLPVMVFGALLFLSGQLFFVRTIEVIAIVNLVFACLLFLSDRMPQQKTDFMMMGWRDAALIGVAQVAALLPGASRAGTVISMARGLGFSREAATRFALFLALPTISGALVLSASQLETRADLILAALVAILSFMIALFVLIGFIRISRTFSLSFFVIYRLALSAALFMLY